MKDINIFLSLAFCGGADEQFHTVTEAKLCSFASGSK
jgi:hypothetical protein